MDARYAFLAIEYIFFYEHGCFLCGPGIIFYKTHTSKIALENAGIPFILCKMKFARSK